MPETTRPIRVLRIIARLNVGGPALHVSLLTARLNPPDYESMLVCGNISADEGDMAYYAEALGVEPVILPTLGRSLHPLRDLQTLWTLYRLMRQFRPDVVHTHTAKAGFVGRIAAWLARVPVIVHTFHGHVLHGYFSPAKTRLFRLLEQITGRMSDAILTLTPDLRDELVEVYHIAPHDKFHVLPLGLDLEPYARLPRHNGAFRQTWYISADAALVGIVGRLVPIKNHALFIQAAEQVRQTIPEAHFVIIGDGETWPALEAQIAAAGLTEAVTFTGWQRDVAAAISDMDVLVISSDNEGTPTAIIQALSGGCPVVSTAVGGIPDLLEAPAEGYGGMPAQNNQQPTQNTGEGSTRIDGKWGALVPPGEANALAAAISDVLRNPPDGTAAQTAMIARYSVDRLADDMDALYRKLLDQAR